MYPTKGMKVTTGILVKIASPRVMPDKKIKAVTDESFLNLFPTNKANKTEERKNGISKLSNSIIFNIHVNGMTPKSMADTKPTFFPFHISPIL